MDNKNNLTMEFRMNFVIVSEKKSNFNYKQVFLEEIEAVIILNHFPSLHARQMRKLIEHFGSARQVLLSSKIEFSQVAEDKGNATLYLDLWETDGKWKRDLELIAKSGVEIIPYWDDRYPESLRKLDDHPVILYLKGTLLPSDQQAVAIVGTRICTLYGREAAEKFGAHCAACGFTVVSGLARGIDTHAHLGALKTGRTIAVIGSGLAHIYPRENEELAAKISTQGAVISELPMNAIPAKHHFPKRNRLVCALSQGVFLAEAPIKSGAMITMDLAFSQKKDCFTLPGRADMESFRGNHYLIKTHKAKLVENAHEMLSILQKDCFPHADIKKEEQCSLFDLDPEEQKLMKSFPAHEVCLEELSLLSKFPVAKLSSLLMGLVLKQKIREFPGKFYQKA
jgi:DNA processing protein